HRVYVPECRDEPVKELTTLRRALNSAFLIGARRWRWRSYFPHQRTSMLRVHREQTMQHAGAAARQPYDKKRVADFLAGYLWIKLPVPLHLEARTQGLQNVGSQCNFSDQVELCLVLT